MDALVKLDDAELALDLGHRDPGVPIYDSYGVDCVTKPNV